MLRCHVALVCFCLARPGLTGAGAQAELRAVVTHPWFDVAMGAALMLVCTLALACTPADCSLPPLLVNTADNFFTTLFTLEFLAKAPLHPPGTGRHAPAARAANRPRGARAGAPNRAGRWQVFALGAFHRHAPRDPPYFHSAWNLLDFFTLGLPPLLEPFSLPPPFEPFSPHCTLEPLPTQHGPRALTVRARAAVMWTTFAGEEMAGAAGATEKGPKGIGLAYLRVFRVLRLARLARCATPPGLPFPLAAPPYASLRGPYGRPYQRTDSL